MDSQPSGATERHTRVSTAAEETRGERRMHLTLPHSIYDFPEGSRDRETGRDHRNRRRGIPSNGTTVSGQVEGTLSLLWSMVPTDLPSPSTVIRGRRESQIETKVGPGSGLDESYPVGTSPGTTKDLNLRCSLEPPRTSQGPRGCLRSPPVAEAGPVGTEGPRTLGPGPSPESSQTSMVRGGYGSRTRTCTPRP